MEVPNQKIKTKGKALAIEVIGSDRFIVAGQGFLSEYDSWTLKEKRSIEFDFTIEKLAVDTKDHLIIAATTNGLIVFSSLDLSEMLREAEKSKIDQIFYVREKKTVVYSVGERIFMIDLDSRTVTPFEPFHTELVTGILYDENFAHIFTASRDQQVAKWDWKDSVPACVERASFQDPTSFSFSENNSSIMIGCEDGSLHELRKSDLKEIISENPHSSPITCIAYTDVKSLVTGDQKGNLKFHFLGKPPVNISQEPIFSIAPINFMNVACACGEEGVEVVFIPVFAEGFSTTLTQEEIDEIVKSLLADIEKIKSEDKSKYITFTDVIHDHFCRLLQIPSLHCFRGNFLNYKISGNTTFFEPPTNRFVIDRRDAENKKVSTQYLDQDFAIKHRAPKEGEDFKNVTLDLFPKGLRLEGKLPLDSKDPINDIKVKILRKGKRCWEFEEEQRLRDMSIEGVAQLKLKNGVFRTYLKDGDIDLNTSFVSTLEIDGQVFEITDIIDGNTLIDSQRNFWVANIAANSFDQKF